MRLRLLSTMVLITHIALSVPNAPTTQSQEPAPVVSMIFANESNSIENLFSLAESGDYFGAKNVGLYYPYFLVYQRQVKRDAFAFDPLAMVQGINTYPFMFTYKGGFYYLVFSSTKLLEEKDRSQFSFFATIIKVADIQEKSNSAQIDTIANLFFNQNDTLALGLLADRIEFYNVTQKTKAGFVAEKPAQGQGPVKLSPKTMPKKKKVVLQGTRKPVAARPVKGPLLKPKTVPVPVRQR